MPCRTGLCLFFPLHAKTQTNCSYAQASAEKPRLKQSCHQQPNAKAHQQHSKQLIAPAHHPTPLCIRTHSINPVPFFIYSSANEVEGIDTAFTEASATLQNDYVANGYTLMEHLLKA